MNAAFTKKVHLHVNCGIKALKSGEDYHRLIRFVSALWQLQRPVSYGPQ